MQKSINVKQLTRALWGCAVIDARVASPHPQAEMDGARNQFENVIHNIAALLPNYEDRAEFLAAVKGSKEPF